LRKIYYLSSIIYFIALNLTGVDPTW